MLIRTHLAITLFFILLFIGIVEDKIVFVFVSLLATLIPDVDSKNSTLGNKKIFRPLQFFLKHRGLVHSFTFLVLITFIFVMFLPILAFPFFLGYSSHLVADSFTQRGIRPFYPSKKNLSGKVRTGGKVEVSIFMLFVLGDLFLFVLRIAELF